jgi:hypothetical protein
LSPRTSTGVDGPASLTRSDRARRTSLRTLPYTAPATKLSPTFNVPF